MTAQDLKRKIIGITGIRSEYDIMSSVFAKIQNHPSLSLELIVTGAHLSEMYGSTINEIRQDGFQIAETVDSLINSDSSGARVKSLGIQMLGFVQTLDRLNPDFLLVLGDREEAMSTALVGAYMNIPVAHVSGGDRVVGNVDDQVRHAVTKLSHLHFATNVESYERILKLGEEPFRVFNTGNPGLDRLLKTQEISHQELSQKLNFPLQEGEPFIVLIQHSISSEIENSYEQMRSTLEAIKQLKVKTVIIYPNSDAGSQQIIKAILEYKDPTYIHIAKNLPRLEFVNLMRKASCLVGNSSSGILEAPVLKLPVVNVGNRQTGRLHAENVEFVPHEPQAILAALKKALYDSAYRQKVKQCSNPYGDGNSSQKIVDILANIPIDKKLLIKDITY